MIFRLFFTFMMIIIIVGSIFQDKTSKIENQNKSAIGWNLDPNSAEFHDTIFIDGDEQLETFCSVGSGSLEEPYIIENLKINASKENGIAIQNTNAYLLIQNCSIIDGLYTWYHGPETGWDTSKKGLYIFNCANIILFKNKITRCSVGITVENSKNVQLQENTCVHNHDGIYVQQSININLSENNCSYTGVGIEVKDSDRTTLTGNTVSNNYYGLHLFGSFYEVSKNNCSFSKSHGVVLSGSNISFFENDCSYNQGNGIELPSSGNVLANNTFNYNKNGIDLEGDNNEILNNNISNNNLAGIKFWFAHQNRVSNNIVTGNYDYGLIIENSDNNQIIRNQISYNFEYGISLVYSQETIIWNNMFVKNRIAQAITDGISLGTKWDKGYIGNYWGDYSARYSKAKPIADGILWNTPYEVGRSSYARENFVAISYDNHPLVSPSFAEGLLDEEYGGIQIKISGFLIIYFGCILFGAGYLVIYHMKKKAAIFCCEFL